MINGAILRQLRKSAGLTQTQLAQRLGQGGYTKFVVAAIENDHRNIGIRLLGDWANACGFNCRIVFEKEGESHDDAPGDVTLPPNFDGLL